MAKAKHSSKGGDGSKVPSESVELEGAIITAARSTMVAESFERGYGEPPERLKMRQAGAIGRP
jgi:hypothetical protein